jgi:hypothetical protein
VIPAENEPPVAVFNDARGAGRALRVTWHPETQLLVLSVWRDEVCIATHRLEASELPRFAHLITDTMAVARMDVPATA